MKHPLLPTLSIILLFIIAQVMGIAVINAYINTEQTEESGTVTFDELPFGQQRPDISANSSFLYIAGAVLIGTVILLALIKFKLFTVWKLWFLLAIALALVVAFNAFVNEWIALACAGILAVWRIAKPNIIVHNLSEVFIYAGIAAMFIPIMNILAASLLLILISIYDYWAVFRSKHMIALAQASKDVKIFPGLHINYGGVGRKMKIKSKTTSTTEKMSSKKRKEAKEGTHWAVLGGGDIAFSLFFAGAVLSQYYFQDFVFLKVGLVIAGATLGLAAILLKGKKDTFYPAMPLISLGCFAGFVLGLLF